MHTDDWKYQNHALFPNTFPHEEANTALIQDGGIWKQSWPGVPLMARWTSDFDCGYETNWWFCVCDEAFRIDKLKAKRRYEINKGIRFFEVREINPLEYLEELYGVVNEAALGYPPKYRSVPTKDQFFKSMQSIAQRSNVQKIYGAFFRETGELVGYAHVPTYMSWAALSAMKSAPAYEKYGVNAALVHFILTENEAKLSGGGYYICDSQRNIYHETHFPEYLEKYFFFRKAYCRIHLVYNPWFGWIVKALYPFRNMIQKLQSNGIFYKIYCVLKMEEIIHHDNR